MRPSSNIIFKNLSFLIAGMLTACGEPEQKFKVTVMDESNTPMKEVEVSAWFNRRGKNSPLDSYKVTGSTNAGGLVELQGETVWYQSSVSAQPEGYYKSMKYGHWTITRNANRWEPWPVEVNLVMKKIRNPKPMYAVRPHGEIRFRYPNQSMDKAYGFDLMSMDWVAPHGRGQIADMMIRFIPNDPSDKGFIEENGRRIYHERKGNVVISFLNRGDGIQIMDDSGGSQLVGPAQSPENGYLDRLEFPNTMDKAELPTLGRVCHVFRVRTVLDEDGKVKSTYYGKIDGGIKSTFSAKPFFRMTYYLSGKPNDRTLEWDKKNNLFDRLDRQYWPERH